MKRIKFSEIKSNVESRPGLYEMYTNDGTPLKVGIAKELRKRLLAHSASKQSRLKLKVEELGYVLGNVESKQSILAKHLYFDSSITQKYDLKTEYGRVGWLENECHIIIRYTNSRDEARELEKVQEASGVYRYVGRVNQR